MIKKSFFVNVFLKIYSFIASVLKKSFIWGVLSKLNSKFNNSVNNSAIVEVFSSETSVDKLYGDRYGKFFGIVSGFVKKLFSRLVISVKQSKFITTVFEFCDNFTVISLSFPGIFLLVWGALGLAGNLVVGAKGTAIILCALIMVAGLVLVLINKSFGYLMSDSFLFSRWFKDGKTADCGLTYSFFIISGLLFGLLSTFFGIIPVAVCAILLVAVIIGFKFTWQVAILYVCVLPFMPTMVMVGGGIALLLCVAVKSILGYDSKLFNESYVFNMYLLFMGIAFALAAAFSYVRNSSIKIAMVYIAFLLAAYALIRILAEKKSLIWLINGISLFSIPVSLYGIYQHFSGFDKQNTWIDTEMFEDISGRVVSFFGNPNVFGEYLILVILTSVVCFYIAKDYKVKAIHLLAAASSFVSLIFTYSRGCWIGVVFAVAIFLFMSKRKLFLAFCVLGAVSIFFLPDSIITRIASVGNMADSSTSYRVYIWEGTLNMLKDFWVTGIGLGSDAFNAVYPFYAYSAITAPHPHNLYLVIMTETGIVGAISFILIILLYYKKLFCVIKNSDDKNLKLISSGLVAAMSGFLLQGMFDNVWYNYRVFLLFWIYIALGAIVDIVSK